MALLGSKGLIKGDAHDFERSMINILLHIQNKLMENFDLTIIKRSLNWS